MFIAQTPRVRERLELNGIFAPMRGPSFHGDAEILPSETFSVEGILSKFCQDVSADKYHVVPARVFRVKVVRIARGKNIVVVIWFQHVHVRIATVHAQSHPNVHIVARGNRKVKVLGVSSI